LGPGGAVLVVDVVVVVVMPESSSRPSVALARDWLGDLAQAWIVMDSMTTSRNGTPLPVRVKQIDPPAPLDLHAVDEKRPVEAFAATYSALLLQRALRESKPEVRASMWTPRRGDGTVELLAAIAANVGFFLEHPTAVVAWSFWDELEALHIATAWARRGIDRVKRVSIGVPCRECEGVYEIEVSASSSRGQGKAPRRAFGADGPKAVCSLNEKHKMAAREVDA